MKVGARRRARSYALQVLYALDLNPLEEPTRALLEYAGRFDLRIDEEAGDFARSLIEQVYPHLERIDERIQTASRNWRIERMSRVDRNVLRLAVGELSQPDGAAARVVINEAVELAKRFGTTESPAFVNGILDRVDQHKRDDANPNGGQPS
ncbi:transcription antitermination factor NusB [Haliangium ochraceum]|uniref:Transcription antitermination protein NusB n=1 Tax=Haliangium ochraceum (strain DSM 14365 / JCM 11303 / SMP-2) TaxID=502025 RepID=D0LW51_HALO1|nr:transcription antitermination factor NusB [Haliangium ochraceum]ACY15983.1 NusB antitermination factor [Haliangium ochraceum DSM 14365]